MRGACRVTVLGNLGQDPDIRTTRNGKSVANMSVAVNEQWTKEGEKQERTEWVRCVLWEKLADVAARYLHKGDAVYLEGKLQSRDWDDREGNKRKTTEVVVSNLIMLGGRNNRQDVEQPEHPNDSPRNNTNGWDDSPQSNGKPDAREEVDDVPF